MSEQEYDCVLTIKKIESFIPGTVIERKNNTDPYMIFLTKDLKKHLVSLDGGIDFSLSDFPLDYFYDFKIRK